MFVNIQNVDIHYEVYGDGDRPLLLLHGWMASIPAMAPIWRHFMATRKVYVIDFPGQGGETKEPPCPWGVPEYGEMVKEFIRINNLEKVDVIGHSFGGRVIIYLASKYPDIFGKIVLTDAAGIKPKGSIKTWIKVRVYKLGRMLIRLTNSKENSGKKLDKLRKTRGSSEYVSLKSEVMRKTFSEVINLNLTKNLKQIKNSTLLIWGENDLDTPLYMAKIMEKNIPDSGLVVIKNAGHFSYIDSPGEYNLIVEKFLGG